jgi:hypothetical protein
MRETSVNGCTPSRVMSCLAMALVPWLLSGRAEAQWGYGFGWGSPSFNYVPSPTDFLNQRALVNATSASSGPSSNNVYADSSNAYYNHIRDDTFRESYDYETRRSPSEARIARSASRTISPAQSGASTRPTPDTAAAKPVVPIASFFGRDEVLSWPSDAPTGGDLGMKRTTSDNASLAVLREYNRQGVAQIATVTDARQKLLDYGKPALHLLRSKSTVRVADAFHLFLLSLYESLAQAATRQKTLTP